MDRGDDDKVMKRAVVVTEPLARTVVENTAESVRLVSGSEPS